MKSTLYFWAVVIIALYFLSGCAKSNEEPFAYHITADQCTLLVKEHVLDGTISTFRIMVDGISRVELDGQTYILTDDCKNQIKNYGGAQ